MTLAEQTFPCKNCKWYIQSTTFPLEKCWCTNKDKDGFIPIRWVPNTGWSCKEKEKGYVQLQFDFGNE